MTDDQAVPPPAAIKAAAEFLHDTDCDDGDVTTCDRWLAGSDPSNQFHTHHVRHVQWYQQKARGALAAAAPAIAAQARAEERARIVDLARDAWLAELMDGDTDE